MPAARSGTRNGSKSKQVCTVLENDTMAKVEAAAEAEMRSLSAMIHVLVTEALAARAARDASR